jgi:hypothetical protein
MQNTPLHDPAFVSKIVDLVNAGTRIIQLRSHERERVRALATALVKHPEACHELTKSYCWCLSAPAFNIGSGKTVNLPQNDDVEDQLQKLRNLLNHTNGGIWVLEDFQHVLSAGYSQEQAIDFLATEAEFNRSLILLGGPGFDIPNEIQKEVAVVDLPLPDDEILKHIAFEVTGVESPDEETISAARGLTQTEAKRAFLMAWQKTGALDGTDARRIVSDAKAQAVKGGNLLEFFDIKQCEISDVGGMGNVKKWLQKRKIGLRPSARKLGLDAPKGMLLLGVQGCGKSMLAKAVAHEWGLPLLRLDFGKVMNMWMGKTEENIRSALQVADATSPCVLWVDEIEKGIPRSGPGDEGTGLRVLGTLLTWMQEKKSSVFVVATANSVSDLPPELLRKGRFDEIFFVDLPDRNTRSKIFGIHIAKRGHSIPHAQLAILADQTEGFSGAEIEACVSEGLYNWANEGMTTQSLLPFGPAHITEAIKATRPLSVLMSEKINELRAWAATRTRPAAGDESEGEDAPQSPVTPSSTSMGSPRRPLPERKP